MLAAVYRPITIGGILPVTVYPAREARSADQVEPKMSSGRSGLIRVEPLDRLKLSPVFFASSVSLTSAPPRPPTISAALAQDEVVFRRSARRERVHRVVAGRPSLPLLDPDRPASRSGRAAGCPP